MNKRPKEIEEAIDYIDGVCPAYITKSIINYIEQLERVEQELLNEMERMADDGK